MNNSDLTTDLEEHLVVDWKIRNFTSLKTGQSPKFSVNKSELAIRIYTATVGYLKCVCMYLYPCQTFCGQYTIGLKRIDGTVFRYFTQDDFEVTGPIPPSISEKEIVLEDNQVLHPDGSVIAFCKLNVSESKTERAKKALFLESAASFCQNFKDFLNSEHLSDVTIKVQDREYRAHKVILAAQSSVFASMFEHNMSENNTGVVQIAEFDKDCFQDFLIFLYSADPRLICYKNAAELYKMSDKYCLDNLKKQALHFLLNNMHVNHICDTLQLAALYNETILYENAKQFFVQNWTEIVKTGEWKKFLTGNPLLANELFMDMADVNSSMENMSLPGTQ